MLSFSPCSYAAEPPKKGNFALPGSQQPGSFISIGQNILGKKQSQLNLMADDYVNANSSYSVDLVPNYIYGVTDSLSVLFNAPIAARYKQWNLSSSGLEDFSIQFEYAYHAKQTKQYTQQGTVLANITFPTGSTEKQPPTGVGALSTLVGTTFIRSYQEWYGFVSPGAFLNASSDGTRYGNKYLYQFGLGRNIYSCPSKYITAWLVEFDGQYVNRNTIKGIKDPNSGGNVLYVTPSFWYSANHLILQFGIGKAVTQHLFGNQNQYRYVYAANIGWTF